MSDVGFAATFYALPSKEKKDHSSWVDPFLLKKSLVVFSHLLSLVVAIHNLLLL
jgi:hypothetical protein